MASLWETAPLSGIKVVELAGLAPGPFCGMVLADFGATVLRVDRAHPLAYVAPSPEELAEEEEEDERTANGDGERSAKVEHESSAPETTDKLTQHKSSVALDLKSAGGLAVLRALLNKADVLIDPFRPGVLEKMGLPPATLHLTNPGLIVARLTGFRRDGKYSAMAGHDINYLAVSGVLSQLGTDPARPPEFPANLLGDFAGGGLACAAGVLLALLARERRAGGRGQVVEANMVDGAAYLATFLRLARRMPFNDGPRGTNLLDGGSPWYGVYETADAGRWMSVGALEPQFFALLAEGLGLEAGWSEWRWDRARWPELRRLMAARFRSRPRAHWERVFDGSDACCAPVLDQAELEADARHEVRPLVALSATPARPPADRRAAWVPTGLRPGQGGRRVLRDWLGWREGRHYRVEGGGLVKTVASML